MTTVAARERAHDRETLARRWPERLLAVLPIVTVYVWLCFLYAWESWGHVTPWLFSDELELAQLSRAVAETGEPARRGVAHGATTLYTYVLAPIWWIDDMETAYSAAKYLGVIVMTSVLFPAYALGRLVVSHWPALFAAAAAATIPALYYSSILMDEPLAYPYATLCLFLIAKALAVRTRWWIAGAVLAALVAPLVREQLAMIPAAFLLAALAVAWTSGRARRVRADWTRWDWVGAIVLAAGAVIVVNVFISHRSFPWLVATMFYKDRMIENGLWAAGALTIGLGVLPVVAGLAALVPLRGQAVGDRERAFTATAAAAIAAFGWYTAVKASYISTVSGTYVVERNIIYVAPVLFIATALFFERARVRLLAVPAAAALALYLILTTPYHMDVRIYADAPGLAILQAANRAYGWTPARAQNVLLGLLVLSVFVLLLPSAAARFRPALRLVFAAAGVGVVAWNVTGQMSAASASNTFSQEVKATIEEPLDWLDETTGGDPVLYLGQKITDQNAIWQLEFWNRSLRHVWSVDGTAPGPGPTLTPDVISRKGELTRAAPGVHYVVADPGIDLVGDVVDRHKHRVATNVSNWRLWRIRPPLRLQHQTRGIYADGWAGRNSDYSQFTTPGGRPGYAVVTVSRKAWGGKDKPGRVTIRVGELVLGKDRQPALGRVTATCRWTVHRLGFRSFLLPTPKPPFHVTVRVAPTFSPAELDPRLRDTRQFGALVGFGFRRARGEVGAARC